MNILLSQLIAEPTIRQAASDWLVSEPSINAKFLTQHFDPIKEASEDSGLSTYLGDSELPAVRTDTFRPYWAQAKQVTTYPRDRPWLQIVDLPEGWSLLVPDEDDPAERILLTTPVPSRTEFSIVRFDVVDGLISTFTFPRQSCRHTKQAACGGTCRNGNPCAFRVYVGGGPERGFCEC